VVHNVVARFTQHFEILVQFRTAEALVGQVVHLKVVPI
jgi:hypothetical protein